MKSTEGKYLVNTVGMLLLFSNSVMSDSLLPHGPQCARVFHHILKFQLCLSLYHFKSPCIQFKKTLVGKKKQTALPGNIAILWKLDVQKTTFRMFLFYKVRHMVSGSNRAGAENSAGVWQG